MSDPRDDDEQGGEHEDRDRPEPATCCPMRRKIVVGILKVLSEEECGVPEAELADVMRFDLTTPDGKPVLAFRFCPWCGKPRDPGGETRVVDVRLGPFDDPDPDGEGPDEDDRPPF